MKKAFALIIGMAMVLVLVGSGCGTGASAKELRNGSEAAPAAGVTPAPTQAAASQAWLGISVVQVNQLLSRRFNLDVQQGVVIATVALDSPAAKAGLKRGDLIKAINDKPVNVPADVVNEAGQAKVGDVVPLAVERNKTDRTVEVTAAARPASPAEKAQPKALPPALKGLQGLSPSQLQDNALGWSFKLKDKDGNVVTITGTPGKVSKIDQSSITITPNDPQVVTTTFKLTSDTVIRTAKGTNVAAIQVGDQVTVVTVNGSDQATAILSFGMIGMKGQGLGNSDLLPRLKNFLSPASPRQAKPTPTPNGQTAA